VTGANEYLAVSISNELAGLYRHAAVYDVAQGQTLHFFVRPPSGMELEHYPIAYGGALRFGLAKFRTPRADDVFAWVSGFLACYRDGTLIGLLPAFGNSESAGIAIDYTRRPIPYSFSPTYPDDLHEDYRLYLGVFGSDFVQIVDLPTLGMGPVGAAADDFEINFIFHGSGTLAAANNGMGCVDINRAGRLAVGWHGKGFQQIADGGNAASPTAFLDRAADVDPSTADSAWINTQDAAHVEDHPDSPFPAATVIQQAYEAGGSQHLKFSRDGRTLYYTSPGVYKSLGAVTIKRISVDTGDQLPDFATVPVGTGPNPDVRGVCELLDGGLLVCNGSIVQRLSPAGAVVQTYTPSPAARAKTLVDVNLTVNGQGFWVLDNDSGTLFKFALESGAQLVDTWTQLGSGNSMQFVVFHPSQFPPAEPPNQTVVHKIRRVRRAPHLANEHRWLFFKRFELDCKAGIGLPLGQGVDPQVMLRYSDDGGETWSPEHWESAGKVGDYARSVEYRQLGQSRNRIFEVIVTDPVAWTLLNGYLDIGEGTH